MAGVKIELLQDRDGLGDRGDIVIVGRERADRWCREGIAVLPEAKSAGRKPNRDKVEKAKAAAPAADKTREES